MGRGPGKGKRGGRGGGRGGGGKMFVANIEEMQMRESQVHASRRERAERRGEDDEEDEDDDSGSGSESGSDQGVKPDVHREEAVARMAEARRAKAASSAAAASEGEGEDDAEAVSMGGLLTGMKGTNPNQARAGKVEFSAKDLNDAEVVDQDARMSRKEREVLEAQRRKEDYMRRHLAGETEAAKADLDRLALVRKRREEARLKAETEGRAPGMSAYGLPDDEDEDGGKPSSSEVAKATSAVADMIISESAAKKRAAALAEAAAPGPEDSLPKLKSMDIKKMNGDALKDALKARGLNVQGQKKDLIQRLIDYEAARK